MKFKSQLAFLLLLSTLLAISQSNVQINPIQKGRKSDTTRILDLSEQLSLWTYGINKLYAIKIKNENTKNELNLSPNGQTNFGFGFNYKWMGLGVAFKLPLAKNDDDIYGKTSRLDFQMNIFARSFGLDFSAQYYKGYYVSNPEKFTSWDQKEYPQLSDLETLSMELSSYYFTNHKEFSYRAAFVRNEIQKKGAGSLILGMYTRMDIAASPEGFIPEELPNNLKDTFDISAFRSINYGLSLGYTYTFVIWKKFFINLSLVPGVGLKSLIVYTSEGEFKPRLGLSARFVSRAAIGYEHKYFYLGIASINITNSFSHENLHFSASTTKFRFYLGKRFAIRKKK